MSDLVVSTLQAAASQQGRALPLAFAAGVVTSAGPCVAPRYLALAAVMQTGARPWALVCAYVVGLVGAMVLLGLAVDALASVRGAASVTDALLAGALAVAGIVVLARGGAAHAARRTAPVGLGGVALLGASGALVVSPCCTPVLAAIAGLTLGGGTTASATAVLTAYALGHALPLVGVGVLGTRLARGFARMAGSHAPATVGGTLMLALASYYGVLA
ncbi:MAG TPA: cytochrome c biogenesis protein CcdA [Candidatus Sulfotelmatobacter sp.]|nr:cytochrome c biogenesis protein CcdA [Candidatus Sulfotelmatobacter sp.]